MQCNAMQYSLLQEPRRAIFRTEVCGNIKRHPGNIRRWPGKFKRCDRGPAAGSSYGISGLGNVESDTGDINTECIPSEGAWLSLNTRLCAVPAKSPCWEPWKDSRAGEINQRRDRGRSATIENRMAVGAPELFGAASFRAIDNLGTLDSYEDIP